MSRADVSELSRKLYEGRLHAHGAIHVLAQAVGELQGAHDVANRSAEYVARISTGAAPYSWRTESFALAATDAGTLIEVDVPAATITLPRREFPVGCCVAVMQGGAGIVSVVAAEGVTVGSVSGPLTLAGEYAQVQLRQLRPHVWVLSGDLVPTRIEKPRRLFAKWRT